MCARSRRERSYPMSTMFVRPMAVTVGQPGPGFWSSVHGSSAQRHVDTHAACAAERVRVTRPHRHRSKTTFMLLPMVPLVWCWHDPGGGGCAVKRRKFLAKQACMISATSLINNKDAFHRRARRSPTVPPCRRRSRRRKRQCARS
eukprot:scaffold27364_cov132-Isochrysis_galbana.AAC.2